MATTPIISVAVPPCDDAKTVLAKIRSKVIFDDATMIDDSDEVHLRNVGSRDQLFVADLVYANLLYCVASGAAANRDATVYA